LDLSAIESGGVQKLPWIPGITNVDAIAFLERNKKHGVEIKWFGGDDPSGFTSNHKSWQYVEQQSLDASDKILSSLFYLRLPLTFLLEDYSLLSEIIGECAEHFILQIK
jgi:hypothetical protein